MEKRRPHYALADVKAAFADPAKLNRSFDKSMTAHADQRVWQDVYRPKVAGAELYVKFTVDAQTALFLISFKEA